MKMNCCVITFTLYSQPSHLLIRLHQSTAGCSALHDSATTFYLEPACLRCYVISPPAFLSASVSSSISGLPFCELLFPPVVFPPYQETCSSPLCFFDFLHEIFYFGLFNPLFQSFWFCPLLLFSILLSIAFCAVMSFCSRCLVVKVVHVSAQASYLYR